MKFDFLSENLDTLLQLLQCSSSSVMVPNEQGTARITVLFPVTSSQNFSFSDYIIHNCKQCLKIENADALLLLFHI